MAEGYLSVWSYIYRADGVQSLQLCLQTSGFRIELFGRAVAVARTGDHSCLSVPCFERKYLPTKTIKTLKYDRAELRYQIGALTVVTFSIQINIVSFLTYNSP